MPSSYFACRYFAISDLLEGRPVTKAFTPSSSVNARMNVSMRLLRSEPIILNLAGRIRKKPSGVSSSLRGWWRIRGAWLSTASASCSVNPRRPIFSRTSSLYSKSRTRLGTPCSSRCNA